MTSPTNNQYLTHDDFIDARNIQDQQLNAELTSFRFCLETTNQRIDAIHNSLSKEIQDFRSDFASYEREFDSKFARRFQEYSSNLEHQLGELNARVERQKAFSRNNALRNPTLRIEPVVALHPDAGVILPDQQNFPRHAKQFYALRRPDTPARRRMLGYLLEFYHVEYASWRPSREQHDYDYESNDDEEDAEVSDASQDSSSQLSLEDAVDHHSERAVEALEGILGLNEENFINFRERAKLRSPPRAVKRQIEVAKEQTRVAKRIPKPIVGRAPPRADSLLLLYKDNDGDGGVDATPVSPASRLTTANSARQRLDKKIQAMLERGTRSSEGSPTNADTLSRDEGMERRRVPSDL